MRVLVTGGAGFIGSHLSEHLVREGHQVSIVDDLNDQVSDAKKGHVNYAALVGRQRAGRRAIGLLEKARRQSRKLAINTFLLDSYAETLIKTSINASQAQYSNLISNTEST